MSYTIDRREAIPAALRRIAREQVDRALSELADPELAVHDSVHQVRKRCKKLRGLARLVRPVFPGYSAANARYRDSARMLSELRDRHSLIEVIDEHGPRLDSQEALAPVRRRLVERRDRYLRCEGDQKLEAFRQRLERSRRAIDDWVLKETGFEAVSGGFQKTLARVTDQLARSLADPSKVRLHQWRKRVKYHWYHLRLVTGAFPELLEPRADFTHKLSSILGDIHDLDILDGFLAAENEADFQDLRRELTATRRDLTSRALDLGRRLFVERPKRQVQRLEGLWKIWRSIKVSCA